MVGEMFEHLEDEERPIVESYQKSIDTLSEVQLEKLWHHRNKGRWEDLKPMEAFKLLLKEAAELLEAVNNGYSVRDVWREAADVANFAMMMAENYEKLGSKTETVDDDIPL